MNLLNQDEVVLLYEDKPGTIKYIHNLSSQVEKLGVENAELKLRLNSNSTNSSKPPSSDGLRKPKSLRETGGKKGAPDGHEGFTLCPVETPDRIISHHIHICENCQTDLSNVNTASMEKRQVFDIPSIKMEVTEHLSEQKECPSCGHMNHAAFPEEVKTGVQYGNRVKSLATCLNVYHLVPLKRTQEIIEDLTDHTISESTILSHQNKLYEQLAPQEEIIHKKLLHSDRINNDESSVRVGKNLNWVHVTSNESLTLYHISEHRGRKAFAEQNILPHYTGTVVHDCFKSYFGSEYLYTHALCGAHLMRECRSIHENDKQEWAHEMFNLLQDACHTGNQAKEVGQPVPLQEVARIETKYDEIVERGYKQIPKKPAPVKKKKGKPAKSKAENLLDRFVTHKPAVLRSLHELNVPFSNNQAEQDVRMVKVRQKVSGSFRTMNGAKTFARIRGFISTVRKNGRDVIQSLSDALVGRFNLDSE